MTTQSDRPVLAAFDFDGTLTDRHTLWRYLRFLVGARRFHATLLSLASEAAMVVAGRLPVMAGRDLLFARLLTGIPVHEEEQAARSFALEHVLPWLRPRGLACVRDHKQRGHTLAIVSNSAESYLRFVGIALSIEHVIGTRLEARDGRLTGRVLGESCVGQEKVRRLRAHFGDVERFELHAYGDSSGDRELLAMASAPTFRPFRSPVFHT